MSTGFIKATAKGKVVHISVCKKTGTLLANFTLAVTSSSINKNTGQIELKTTWQACSVFHETAELFLHQVEIGTELFIAEADLFVDDWVDSYDAKRETTKFLVTKFEVVCRGKGQVIGYEGQALAVF
jgi:single-stranded DNA-binding protein